MKLLISQSISVKKEAAVLSFDKNVRRNEPAQYFTTFHGLKEQREQV